VKVYQRDIRSWSKRKRLNYFLLVM